MITLDPEFVGSLAPPSKLTTAVETEGAGGGAGAVPFARLPRLERLRVSGKADETEVVSDGADDGTDDGKTGGGKHDREEREKRKMRGKGKSLKRCVFGSCCCCCSLDLSLYPSLSIWPVGEMLTTARFFFFARCWFTGTCASSARTSSIQKP